MRESVIGPLLILALACTPAGVGARNLSDKTLGTSCAGHAPTSTSVVAAPVGIWERNVGQADPKVLFVSRSSKATYLLTRDGLTIRSTAVDALLPEHAKSGAHERSWSQASSTVTFNFADASPDRSPVGTSELVGTSNYFVGSDPAKWVTGIPTFESVDFKSLWPGVDLSLLRSAAGMQFVLSAAKGSDLASARILVDGAGVSTDGSLSAKSPSGWTARLEVEMPFALQTSSDGHLSLRVPDVQSALADTEVGVEATMSLSFLDPGAIYIGGSMSDSGYGIARDQSGNIYTSSFVISADFPVTPGAFDQTYNGSLVYPDIAITKLLPDGATVVYSTFLGKSIPTFGLHVDNAGAVYVAGSAADNTFPTTPGAYSTSSAGAQDVVVTKISPDGGSLVYSTYIGGSSTEEPRHIAVDELGNACVTGWTVSLNYPTTPGAFQSSFTGVPNSSTNRDVFLSRLNASGTALLGSTYLGTDKDDFCFALAVDSAGRMAVGGQTLSSMFPTTPGAFDTSYNSTNPDRADGFLAVVTPDAQALAFSTFLGGTQHDVISGVSFASGNELVVSGGTTSPDFPTTEGAYDRTLGDYDIFVSRFTSDGSTLRYSTYVGGNVTDYPWALALDSVGAVYLTGYTQSADFPTTPGAFDRTYGGGPPEDGILVKLDPTLSSLSYGSYFGGTSNDRGFDLIVDPNGVARISGDTHSSDFALVGIGPSGNRDAGKPDTIVVTLPTRRIIDGSDSAGVFVPSGSAFFLRNTLDPGAADVVFSYGPAGSGWYPLSGDWDGDGRDSPGLYDSVSGFFFLKVAQTAGPANFVFGFGPAGSGWIPIVGDWNGDGLDSVGLYAPDSGAFYLRNSLASGSADLVYTFGPANAGWQPVAGDWDGDGTDTIGLFDSVSSSFFIRNTHLPGPADTVFGFGPPGSSWLPVAGDWDGDGLSTVGLYSPILGVFFLRDTLTPGPADYTFSFGAGGAGWLPLVGDWNGT